jgi:hypothetical protein
VERLTAAADPYLPFFFFFAAFFFTKSPPSAIAQ